MTSILNNVKVFALFYIYLFTNLVNTKETESNKCIRSGTSYNGEMVCQGALIVQELFYDLNQSVWTIEKYIPQEPVRANRITVLTFYCTELISELRV